MPCHFGVLRLRLCDYIMRQNVITLDTYVVAQGDTITRFTFARPGLTVDPRTLMVGVRDAHSVLIITGTTSLAHTPNTAVYNNVLNV